MRLLEDTLSEEFRSGKIKEGDTALVDVHDEGKVYEERYGLPNKNSKNSVSAPVVTLSKDLQGVPLASLSPIS
jgi:hypothetical protein